VGTCGEGRDEVVRRFGGEPVRYGDGLVERVRALAPHGIAAALDAVGTDEAVDVSVALVADRQRVVTIAARGRAQQEGIQLIAGNLPASAAFRDSVRARLVSLAGRGDLVVPVVRTFPLAGAREAMGVVAGGHPGGKLALVP
jgi:hypothetical protein